MVRTVVLVDWCLGSVVHMVGLYCIWDVLMKEVSYKDAVHRAVLQEFEGA